MQDDGEAQMSTEDLVAAFRSRRAARGTGTQADDAADAADVSPAAAGQPPSPQPPPVPAPLPPPLPPLAAASPPPRSSEAPVEASPEPTDEPTDAAPAPGGRGPGSGAIALRPASAPVLRSAPLGAGMLTAAAPALNLSDRLLADRFVAARGSRRGVAAGLAVALAGLAALVVGGTRPWHDLALPAGWDTAAAGLAVLGLALAVLFLFVPRSRSLRVRLAATQREEWARVQGEAVRLRGLALAGGGLAVAGLLLAAAASRLLPDRPSLYVAVGGLAMAAFGLGVFAWASARRGLVQRLYVQTLVLSRLEQTGLGPAAEPDPRVAPVLRALDQLLGALPESTVRRFLASDEATQYLELMDELTEGRRGQG